MSADSLGEAVGCVVFEVINWTVSFPLLQYYFKMERNTYGDINKRGYWEMVGDALVVSVYIIVMNEAKQLQALQTTTLIRKHN